MAPSRLHDYRYGAWSRKLGVTMGLLGPDQRPTNSAVGRIISTPQPPMRSLPSKDDTSYTVATHSLSLKDEDRMCTAVADVCGEAIELLLVADGHGGPEVTQHGQAPTLAVLRARPPP